MIYKNARIVTHEKLIHGYMEVNDKGAIVAIKEGNTTLDGYDCNNNLLLPGFIDAHTHGGYGLSFDDFKIGNDFFKQFTHYLVNLGKEGVVGFVPTNVSLSLEKLDSIVHEVHTYLQKYAEQFKQHAQMVAWFFEGPFINVKKKGAHYEKVLIPINEDFIKLAISKITLPIVCAVAPEVGHNLSMIKKYHEQIIFSLGHSNADYDQTLEAFKSGVKRVIHLYNAMSGFHHHDMGIVNAIYNQQYPSDLSIELISDGVHVSDPVINTTYHVVKNTNLNIVSDCLLAKGLSDGVYHLGTLAVDKRGDWFYLKDTETLAGGGLPYNKLVRHFKEVTNCSWPELVKYSSYNNARNLGLADNYGILQIGAPANFVLIDEHCDVHLTFANGVQQYAK